MKNSSGRPHLTLGLVVHPDRSVLDSVRVITRDARRVGAIVIAHGSDAERVGPEVVAVAPEEFAERVDVVISLGGDGTMLGAMRLVVGRDAPVLGVNLVELIPQPLREQAERLRRSRPADWAR